MLTTLASKEVVSLRAWQYVYERAFIQLRSTAGEPRQKATGTVRLRGYTWVGPIWSGFRAAQDERTTRPDDVWTPLNMGVVCCICGLDSMIHD
jgi:hypothetical protein